MNKNQKQVLTKNINLNISMLTENEKSKLVWSN